MIDGWILNALCVSAFLLVLLVVVIVVILTLKPFKHEKKEEGDNTCLTITAKRDLDKIIVMVTNKKEKMTFERKRIKKGQSVGFAFPTSNKPIKLIVEIDGNRQRAFEL
ncbi:MAG: hypothetical protein ABID61_01240 [Candidatus Micrarchaeota archaeon]